MKKINQFLLDNNILIKDNPCVSTDFTLNVATLAEAVNKDFKSYGNLNSLQKTQTVFDFANTLLYPKSQISLKKGNLFVVESKTNGDCALLSNANESFGFQNPIKLKDGGTLIPLEWENLIILKNITLTENPKSTIFPRATPHLSKTSLGIGARFTTLHWPAVAWSMKTLNLELTANQNSIPRELVFNVDAMLENKLAEVPFPFIGGSVPEGHQGQSVQGMSYGSVLTYLKYGFHQNGIAYGFNADHQPIGGRFDLVEKELVEGSVFASYITYDLSPELAKYEVIEDEKKLNAEFDKLVDKKIYQAIVNKLAELNLSMNEKQLKQLITYITPAMQKMKKRDELYTKVRLEKFTTKEGQAFVKELSIDELPGQTSTETLTACLVMAELMGVKFNFVAPNIGFQKNFPYPDNAELTQKVQKLYAIAQKFGVSFGFHSGSGKSAENYQVVGQVTNRNLEIKTSGRYTYEMGVALSKSKDASDQKLWKDWYEFTKKLAIRGAFSNNEVQKKFARDFITRSFQTENKPVAGIFDSETALTSAINQLPASPEHMFWFEYNFLFVLAGNGSTDKLGDHTKAGYEQRKRFYSISKEGRLLFAKGVASYIIFLAETTGISDKQTISNAKTKLAGLNSIDELLSQIH